ncbi:MAG: UDP-glucose 4-epimerase GalE [Acidimicrobiales bacterium]
MTILVTGGAGYIGSHTVRLLQARGRDVVVLDTMESGHRAAVDAPLVEGDINDDTTVAQIINDFGVDSVVHFAAYKAAGESMADPGKYFRNNVAGTAALLETLTRSGVTRVVFSSSCAVYGTAETVPVADDAPLQPESPYGESKAMVERMLGWYDRCAGVRSVSLRYFNAAGAWPDGSLGEDWRVTLNLVPNIMKSLLLEPHGTLQLYGTDYPTPDGTAIRDYVHVLDLADAHLRALEYLDGGGATTTINLGTGVGSSVLEVIAATERITGRSVAFERRPRRPGDPVALYSGNGRARTLIGWEARYGLDDIVASAWAWHSNHVEGHGD